LTSFRETKSDDLLAGLNPAQREAATTLKGPLLVLSGAGTGKTRVITVRIANLVRHGVKPSRILALTFTNKAAREMRERGLKLLGGKIDDPPMMTTFHSLGVNILRQEAHRLGYRRDFSIYDRGDQESVARASLRELRVPTEFLSPGDFLGMVSRWKNLGRSPEAAFQTADNERERTAAKAFARYQKGLKGSNAFDFDDLLSATEEVLAIPEALTRHQRRWDFVLVDEYQDTNASQERLLRRLADLHKNVCAVGDDDQSIYGWRGAEIRNILTFEKSYPGAKVIRLEENYRCCANILTLANRLISKNSQRREKTLRAFRPAIDEPRFTKFEDETAEAIAVVRDLVATIEAKKLRHRDFAILFRTNEQPRLFEKELRAQNVPYVLVGSYSFFDRREVRDVLSYLRVIAQPSDEVSLLRIINTPPRGIGPKIIERMTQNAVSLGKPIWDVLPQASVDSSLPPRVRSGVAGLVQIIHKYRSRMIGSPTGLAAAVGDLLAEIGFREELRRQHESPEDAEARWEVVGELLNMIAQYESRNRAPTLGGFLEQIALDAQEEAENEREKERDAVTLMTLHAAKGLEFPHVYLVGLEEGILPHRRSLLSPDGIEEERRLAYVGVTRAKDRLTLTRAMTRTRFGRKEPARPSRFLPEMFGVEVSEMSVESPAASPTPTSKPKKKGGRGFRRHGVNKKS
jgi:DNA helicase II / ATP-dependent DNA helicase PcrA